ncbi:MAG: hypothetical protein AAF787_17995 [Chloroflexota bacterium]
MYDDTMMQIIKLEKERQELYRLASHNQLPSARRDRFGQIANELNVLWDQHRREDAARRWGARSMVSQKGKSSTSAA